MPELPKLKPQAQYLSIDYAKTLIDKPSITPDDAGCQAWIIEKLTAIGFSCQQFNINGVLNMVASIGQGKKTYAFAGHTDVVPPGKRELWQTPPFKATVKQGRLIGRGAADMKTGVAAMLAATEKLIAANQTLTQQFVWLITSDEEGEAEYGSQWLQTYLTEQNIQLDACIVGEPTSNALTGDTIKVGRRGSVSFKVNVFGKQGHVAYPDYADNAIHKMNALLNKLNTIKWEQGSKDFPGTSLQITHINSGNFTDNLVPDKCSICFNIRYSAKWSQSMLTRFIEDLIKQVTKQYTIEWDRPCEPYLTTNVNEQCLIHSIEQAIFRHTGKFPLLSTSGGTSDGRFFKQPYNQVVEIGVPNNTIHQVNENIQLSDLMLLEDIYTSLLFDLFTE
ncbi:succinyl-diaminopimelate desuccinylase [Thalassotalea insulae]|uniref:Succinyl-diaminopimelate desuccinylase n=1 Tax=Thalassotalea insulae TaxID=2056778 RepID=A0ABQ6GY95_9GAMM|nr:succinyl-diaminopimelate desuccinylase [Thalassotalea insulae]GLX80299.1 succinyl-diaminopimelate desuccinylase [Thalassotalea insulae]